MVDMSARDRLRLTMHIAMLKFENALSWFLQFFVKKDLTTSNSMRNPIQHF